MHHFRRGTAVAAAMIVTLVSCEPAHIHEPVEPVSSDVAPSYSLDVLGELTADEQAILDDAAAELSRLGAGGQAVTGSIEIFGTRRITVAAFRHPDGTFTGRYLIRDHVAEAHGLFVQGEVVCLSIAGNRALVFGTGETGVPTPGLVDVQSISVTDNGNPGDVLPDQVSAHFGGIRPENVNPTQCTFFPPAGGFDPATQGNMVVHE